MLITKEVQCVAYGVFFVSAVIALVRANKSLKRNRKWTNKMEEDAQKHSEMSAPFRSVNDYKDATEANSNFSFSSHAKTNELTIISQFAGSADFSWDGHCLSDFSGAKIATFDGTYLSRFSGPKLYIWKGNTLAKFSGPQLYKVSNGTISHFAGPAIYRYDKTGISKFAGPKIYSINGAVPVPEAIIIVIAVGLI
ncbi:MAG: hypothetical protein MI866_10840 [Bacteroidales bacterium]|nr:hypothetical protein [Bacteroidales bacterium]